MFSFLATLLALAGFSFVFPFLGDGVDFHRIFIVCVSGGGRPEDASAPRVILSRHAQCVEVSQLSHVQLKMCLQRLRRVRNDARLVQLVWHGIFRNSFRRHDLHEQSRAAFLIGRSLHQAQLSASFETVVSSFLTTFRAPFCVSIVSRYSNIADCCSCGGVAIITIVGDGLAA